MPTKPSASLACVLTAGLLILPACGEEGNDRAAEFAPSDDMRVLERRVGAIERQLRDLRKELKTRGRQERSSTDQPAEETATAAAVDGSAASTPPVAGGPTRSTSVSPPASGAGGSAPDENGESVGGSDGGSDAGSGPDPGTSEEDRTVEDICGPNPAPEC